MNGRIYDPRLGRMLSPDPVTQAPENGQNYNRYIYANNNPLKYSDPSGFEGIIATCAAEPLCRSTVASAFAFIGNSIFGGNGCDRTCKERTIAHNWCKAQSACLAELRANTREKFRKRSAQVIMEAVFTGQIYYYENGRAYIGDNRTASGEASSQEPVVGTILPRVPGVINVTGHHVPGTEIWHLALEFGEGDSVSWISAGPKGLSIEGVKFLVAGVGELGSGIRASDEPAANVAFGFIIPPSGMSSEEYYQILIAVTGSYCNCADYDLFPEIADGYNSNSFVSGLIKATGGGSTVDFSDFVGGGDPLPAYYFGL